MKGERSTCKRSFLKIPRTLQDTKKNTTANPFFINYLDKVDMHFIEVIVEFD